MNIVGENFPKKIVDQINLRQQKKGSKNRNIDGDPSLLVWQNSNTGWVKIISSVDINKEQRLKASNEEMAKNILPNNELAKQYVLFGGVYFQGLGKDGLRSGIGRNSTTQPDSAYGLGGLELGIRPMPGITSFSIKTENRGSLKTATIGIKCYNRHQFDIINTLYLSLGYSILIEWGNTMYYTDEKTFITDNPHSLADDFLKGTYKWDAIIPEINKKRLESCGNYDASLGKVVNFSWTVNRDLSYDITLIVRSIGDVIESLKMNALSGYINVENYGMISQAWVSSGIAANIESNNQGTFIREMYNYLINDIRLDSNQALGVLANIGRESNFKPDATESGGGPGVGLFQYTSQIRKNDFIKNVPDWRTNWQGQLNYAFNKDIQGISFKSKTFPSPEEASLDFLRYFETPWSNKEEQKNLEPIRQQENINYLNALPEILLLFDRFLNTRTYATSSISSQPIFYNSFNTGINIQEQPPIEYNGFNTGINITNSQPTSINNGTNNSPTDIPSSVINNYAYTHDIGALFNNLKNELEINSTKYNGNDLLAIKMAFSDNSSLQRYYIRFGYFLELLEKNIIPKLKGTEQRMIKFDYDIDSNIILLYDRQLSADPTKCIFKRTYRYDNEELATLFPKLNSFTYQLENSETNSWYGCLMNIYFDMTHILNLISDLKDDNGNTTLINLLDALSKSFCNVTGNFNKIIPTVNEDNKIVFIDDVPLPDRDKILKKLPSNIESSPIPADFKMFGYYQDINSNLSQAGIVRDLRLTTTVSPNLASMITIGAQSNGYITGQDSTALSVMNIGLIDRVKNEWIEPNNPNAYPSPDEKTTDVKTLNVKYKDTISSFNKFISKMCGDDPTWDQENINAFTNSIQSFAEYNQAEKTLKIRQTESSLSSSPNIGFLPFDMSITIDGLSGMKVYQKYTADTDFLPSNYPQSLEFLIKGITHEIRENQWITTLESLAIPKNPFGKTDSFNIGAKGTGQPGPSKRAPGAGGARQSNFTTNANYSNIIFQNIGQGNPSKDKINNNLLKDINTAAQQSGVIVSITTAVSEHKPGTRHAAGNAVDIAIINKVPVSPKASNRNKIDSFVNQLQNLGYVKNTEKGQTKSVLTFGFPNHDNHIHVSNIT